MYEPRNYIAEVEAAVRSDPLSVPVGIEVPALPLSSLVGDGARDEVLNVLVAILEVPNGGTRKAAALALAQLGDPRPLNVLEARQVVETASGNLAALNAAITVLRRMPHGSGSTEFERCQAVAEAYSGRPLERRMSSADEGAGPLADSSVTLPVVATGTSKMEELRAFQLAVDRVAPTFSKGSLVAKAIMPVNYVLAQLKSLAFGVPWKLATKAVPPVATIGHNLASLQMAAERLAGPSQILSRILPSVIDGFQARASGVENTPGLSGQLSMIIRTTHPFRENLHELSQLTSSTRSVIVIVSTSMDRLHGIKGIGPLADNLKDSLSRLEQTLRTAEASNAELVLTAERLGSWLPSYYAEVRKAVHSATPCQATVRASFWKKDMCGSPVQRFDDEAPAVCARCGISHCGQHRVEVPSPVDSVERCTWLCIEHARK